ncbi:hypothetical protein [Massilia niastensis]|uniref:hypothetical protein n=1 Tax=Massilia niastensis TaxID=544911 RepID=UPI00036A098A|nr:hypothetical protein [Massilia niastensis]
MSTTLPSPRPALPGWLKGLLLAAVVIVLCWGTAVLFWSATDHAPDMGDALLGLLALPAAVLLALWRGPRLLKRPGSASLPAASSAPVQAKGAARLPPLAMLAASMRIPHGASAGEFAAVLKDEAPHPDLDPTLLDDDGFPLTTARSDEATDEALREEIMEWLSRNEMAGLRFHDEQWRALTLGTAVARELAGDAASSLLLPGQAAPMLRFMPMLPLEWHVEQRRAMAMWLRFTIIQFGWPADRIAMAETAAEESGPATIVQQLMEETAPAIVLACASNIGQDTVDRWEAQATLFKPSRQHGRIPGEGAAGLLLAGLELAAASGHPEFAVLHAGAHARRHTAIDDDRRVDATLLGQLTALALEGTDTVLSDIAMIVADTDHRPRHVLELMEAAAKAVQQLDAADDVVRVGAASGACGAVPFIAALALARHFALEQPQALLCVANADPHRRSVVLVRSQAELPKRKRAGDVDHLQPLISHQ